MAVVKAERAQKRPQVARTPASSSPREKRRKEKVWEESTNYYASYLELGFIPPAP